MREYERAVGAAVAVTEKGRIVLTLPTGWMPERRFSGLRVSCDAAAWYFEATDGGRYHGRRKDRYAWQAERADPEVGARVRKLEYPAHLAPVDGHGNLKLKPFAMTRDVTVRRTERGAICFRVPFGALKAGRQVGEFTKGDYARTEETEDMTTQTDDNLAAAQAIAAAAATTRIVQCEFPGSPGKLYAYYTDDASIEVGDTVVVVSPYDGGYNTRGAHYDRELGGHVVTVQVKSVEETLESVTKVVKWVVGKVDLSGYRARRAKEERIEVLVAKIKKAEAEARKQLELERLRDLSPELGTLLDELKSLRG